MQKIRAITFDLDDTLWDIAPVIARAERKVYEEIRNRFPRVVQRYALEDIQIVRQEILERNPDVAHDLTEIRRLTFRKMLVRCGYEPDESSVLLEQYLNLRHDVEFFLDVIPALKSLSQRYKLMTITNGNADTERLGISHFFEGHISAGAFGILKPDPRIFQHACEVLQEDPSGILHVGDHPIDDVLGALSAGFRAVWINRGDGVWGQSRLPDAQIKNLTELNNMLD